MIHSEEKLSFEISDFLSKNYPNQAYALISIEDEGSYTNETFSINLDWDSSNNIPKPVWDDFKVEFKAQYAVKTPVLKVARDRKEAYPSIADQLDKIYHSGVAGWKEDIKVIKDANPKPV